MREHSIQVTNKYGKQVTLPPTTGNSGVSRITQILDECGIDYKTEYRIDADGCRRSPFDIAVMKNGEPKLFIEYDGTEHFDSSFYLRTGVRAERCKAHVIKAAIAEAKKDMIARRFNIPVLRISESQDDLLRDRVLAWVEVFVNDADVRAGNEVIMIDFLDRYGFDFPYIPPSDMSKGEKARVEELYRSRGADLGSEIVDSPEVLSEREAADA
ncbi:MAG TPA: hypothetical protein PLN48_10025 [Lachnospiraceae bacterium]|jgi:hypothetical protein|nr:hypothetical protein [Lachnospiraceae bacterium]